MHRSATAQDIDFDQVIRPVLSDRCFKCHGPDAETREADLRVDTIQDWSKLESMSSDRLVIHAGAAEKSELYQRVISTDEDLQMPPPDSGLQLSEDEKSAIAKWIDQGAKQTKHWSLIPVADQIPVPEFAAEVANQHPDWLQSPIDAFVLDRLLKNNLQPNSLASKERLVRRLFLDLNGLPPKMEEVQRWSALPRPELVKQLADELMSRPAFGEHLASQWLDAARYSDTYGYQVDRDRFVWPWRDWVVRSLNQNLPYDQFLTQQIAGDLLPDATPDQILATTFCRLHPQKVEGGSVPEEFRIEYVSDRTQTFATAYLGLTMECCRCHDHKYDPLSQENYFQLSSFFDNIDEAGLYSYFTDSVPTPTLVLPDAEKDKQHQGLADQILGLEQEIEDFLGEVEPADLTEVQQLESADLLRTINDAMVGQQDFESAESLPNPSENKFIARESEDGTSQACRLSGDEGVGLPVGNFRRWEPFSISLWMNTPDAKERAVVLHRSRAWTDAASRGYELLLEEGKLKFSLIHFWPGNAISIRSKDLLSVGQWHQVVLTYDGSSTANGLKIFVDGEVSECDVIRDHLTKQIAGGGGDNITLGERFRDRGFTGGLIDDVKVFNDQLNPLQVLILSGKQVEPESLVSANDWNLASKKIGLQQNSKPYQEKVQQLKQARQKLFQLQDGRQEIMVMHELPEPRDTYLLDRGSYDAPTQKVTTSTPEHVMSMSPDLPANRLGLAQWTLDRRNPLTARVVVNRYWQLLFGEGLVRTPEDFGNQGTPPTHPLLLDFLAKDLMENDWDIRRLILMMVQSSTYQQDSAVAAGVVASDPENLLFSRYPNGRRSAEVLRDQALAVSGLLNDQMGGPPVYPYDLAEAFSPSQVTTGDQQYRRSLYCYWKRTGPSPALVSLDAAQRDVCQVKREKTQSPSQALVLLNATQFVEASRALAATAEPAQPVNDRLQSVFTRMLQRSATQQELKVLSDLYEQQLKIFQQDESAMSNYMKVGQFATDTSAVTPELAALTSVVNTLFALDEFICRR